MIDFEGGNCGLSPMTTITSSAKLGSSFTIRDRADVGPVVRSIGLGLVAMALRLLNT